MNNPNVVFAAGGEGMGMDYSIISFHKNYSGLLQFHRQPENRVG